MNDSPGKGAWVALCTKTSYLQGLLVLNHSLRAVNSAYPLVAMITAPFPKEARAVCEHAGIRMKEVESLLPKEGTHQLNEHDLRFIDTWTKFRAFEWTEYDRVITLDCDMLIRKNMDDLFDLPLPAANWVAGAPVCACNPRRLDHYPKDWTPANCAYTAQAHPQALSYPPYEITPSAPRPHGLINGGLIILSPNRKVFDQIVTFLRSSPLISSFSFADQDLYAAFFKNHWQPLPYVYNALKTVRIIHPGLWSDSDVRNIHYILDKPWQHPLDDPHPASADPSTQYLNGLWWAAYEDMLNGMKAVEGSGWEIVDQSVVRR